MTPEKFEKKVSLMKSQRGAVYVYEEDGEVVATGKLLIEHKFYDSVGHVEDVIVDEGRRGRGLGRLVVEFLADRAFKDGCYKIVLECGDGNIPFYEKLGFWAKGKQMVMYQPSSSLNKK